MIGVVVTNKKVPRWPSNRPELLVIVHRHNFGATRPPSSFFHGDTAIVNGRNFNIFSEKISAAN